MNPPKKTQLAIIVLVSLLGCVSKTFYDQRFQDSNSLTPPVTSVSVPDSQNYTFAIVGDLHIGNQDTTRFQQILSMASSEGDSFIVLLGDNVDQGDQADFQAFQAALSSSSFNNKAVIAIGNHDIFNDGWTYYKQVVGPSHYTFTAGNAKFIILDTADGTVGSDQTDWLKAQLAQPKPQLLFLVSHYLPVVPGVQTYLRLSDDSEALHMMNLASNNGVNAWLGGHYHSYLVGGAAGVTYVVAGGGGGRRMGPVNEFFFVQVQVSGGTNINYVLRPLP